MVRLSFILPCYNVEKYIGAYLDSLYKQDIPMSEYELLCINKRPLQKRVNHWIERKFPRVSSLLSPIYQRIIHI